MRVFIGFLIIFFSIGFGWIGGEITRKILILIFDILLSFQNVYEYGYLGYLISTFIIYVLSSIAFVWLTIFLPMIICKKMNIKINWKPSIYFLFFWFALIQYHTSIKILNVGEADIFLKSIIIVANCAGVFWLLVKALKDQKKFEVIDTNNAIIS